MDIKYLRLIEKIVSEGSLTKASAKLHLTQAALSQQLKEIESQLNARIFHRIKNRLVLTDAGKIILSAAQRILPEVDNVMSELKLYAKGYKGTITLATECYTTYFWLPDVIKTFSTSHPNVSIDLNTDNILKPLEPLLDGSVDLAIVHRVIESKKIQYEELFTDDLVIVVSDDHRLAKKSIVKAGDLSGETFITHSKDYKQSVIFERLFVPQKIELKKVLYIPLTDATIELVKSGIGISALPGWLAKPYSKNRGITIRKIAHENLERKWFAATLKAAGQQKYLSTFMDLLKSKASP